MKITVLGAGAWGTALAKLLCDGQNSVTLWGHDASHLDELRRAGRNERYLPGIELPRELKFDGNLANAVKNAGLIIIAVPSKAFREIAKSLADFSGPVVSVTKGIEHHTGLTMSGVLDEVAPKAKVAALSGPSFAIEVARGIPTAVVVAGKDTTISTVVQNLFHRPTFRVYTNADLLGVELGGALKNVIAIAAGVCDGLGFGDNSKAALVTRAISEMRRLGVASGAKADTFIGLSGLGDLMVTCFSRLSRNHGFGERLGRGEKGETIAASTISVAEGFPTARSAYELARKHNVVTPIIDEVYAMLYESKNPARALQDLTRRDLKAED
jgi:glycerol-3-phosphate dehydrogenase (NAD(P)+)